MANNQSQKLAQQIWAIANKLRGSMDASKFKDYILGVIFYRYLSARTESYMNDLLKNDSITYREALADPEYADTVKEWSVEHLGYIIEPDDLFDSLVASIATKSFTIEQFEKAISKLTASTIGHESEVAFANLFDAMDLKDADLGKEVSDRTKLISTIIQKINDTPFARDSESGDVLGTAYMILIGLFQSGAGKKGGEFFTPTCVSTLLAQLTTIGLAEVRNVADGCAGSGSLLLEVKRHLSSHKIGHIWAQEKTGTTYNLLRMNLIMHGVPYRNFSVFNDDTLLNDNFYEDGEPVLFDIQVENPPYSAPNSAANPEYLNDPRYKSAGVLAPKTKADLAFVEGMVYHMADDGRVAVLLPHGVLFRSGSEYDIRKYFIDKLNVVDAVIGLAPGMFHGTGIPVCILYLKKKRNGNSDNILFIDASKHFEKVGKNNALRASDIKRIVDCVKSRSDVDKFSRKVSLEEIRENDYNLNIPRYVDSSETAENWDIYSLMFGGIPEQELAPFAPLFDAFPSLQNALMSKGTYAYTANTDDVGGTVLQSTEVQKYCADFRTKVGGMSGFLKTALIENLDSIDVQSEEDVLADKLFGKLDGVPLIDKYEAYQLLDNEWKGAAADIELIQKDGFSVVKTVEPNMVTKKKDGEEFEVQDGMRGTILPFTLVQKLKLPEDLAEIERKEAELASIQGEIEELLDTFSEEEKETEYGDTAVVDKDKNEFSSKAIKAALKAFKSEYGKDFVFDEDTVESKIVSAAKLLAEETSAKTAIKKERIALDEKTIKVIEGLSDEEAKELLEAKWITPFIENISGIADTVLKEYVAKLDKLFKKYSCTMAEEDSEIAALEASLADSFSHLKGSDADNKGLEELLKLFGGV